MFRCVKYSEAMKAEWDRLALAHGTVFHTIAFRQILLESFGYVCGYHAVVNGENRICALIPLLIGRNLQLKQAGVCLPFVNYTDICAVGREALEFARLSLPQLRTSLGLTYIEVRLKDQELTDSDWNAHLQNYTFTLPLQADEAQVMALSTAGNRNHVRKVYRNDWFSVEFTPDRLPEFHAIYVRRMKQLGSPAQGRRFFQSFFEHLPDNATLLTVLDKATERVAGGMLLLTSPGDATLYYPYGACLTEYNNKYVNNFMYWEAVKFGIRKNMRQLDLGRSPAGSGTFRYKQQWGAQAQQLRYMINGDVGDYGPPDRDKLKLFVELWKLTPGFITEWAGERLIKYVLP